MTLVSCLASHFLCLQKESLTKTTSLLSVFGCFYSVYLFCMLTCHDAQAEVKNSPQESVLFNGWAPETELRLAGLAAGTFPSRAVSQAPPRAFPSLMCLLVESKCKGHLIMVNSCDLAVYQGWHQTRVHSSDDAAGFAPDAEDGGE